MIKSFISKLFKKQEKIGEIKLSLSDLENKIDELKNKENEKVISEGKIIIDNIKSSIKQIKINLKKLTEEEFSNQDERLFKIAEGSRKVLINHISSGLDSILIEKEIDYSLLRELNRSLIMFFNSISKDSKNLYYVSLVFRDHVKEVTGVLRVLENENKKLKEIIDSKNIMNLNNITEKIKLIKDNQSEILKMEKQKQVLEGTIKQQEQRNIQLKEKIEKLRNNDEYKSFLENREKIKTLKTKIEHNEMNIRTHISPLIKLLKKFEHMEADKNKIKNISLIIQNPVDFSLNNYSALKNILIDLEKLIIDNKIHLKSGDKEKKLSKIKEIENDSLYNLIENYKKLTTNLEQSEKRKFIVLDDIIKLKNQILYVDKENMEVKTLKITNSIEKTKQNIVSEKQKIQELCLKINENVIIL